MIPGYKKSSLRILFILISLLVFSVNLKAQPEAREKPARILFLLDASSSMLNKWQNEETRFHAASRIIDAVMDSIYTVNKDVAFALRVFGSEYPAQDKNCFDSRLEVSFGYLNSDQIITRLKYIRPRGFSPIAWSLKEAAENDFVQSDHYAYSIILITDGGESCGGDICETMTTLVAKKISFKPYILSLIDYEPLRKEYDCLGKYLVIGHEKDIAPAIQKIIEDNRKILSIKRVGLQPAPIAAADKVTYHPVLNPVKETHPEVETREAPVPAPKPEVKTVRAPEIKMEKIAMLTQPSRMNLLYTIPTVNPLNFIPLPPVKIVTEAPPEKPVVQAPPKTPAPAPKPVVKKPATKKTEDVVYSTMTEDAPETTLKVYFTDGKGTFYRTEPQMIFEQSGTQKEVKTVYRNMSGDEPSPIKIEPGTYDILIPGSKARALHVSILAHKTNKVYIKAGSGSLAFYYPTAPDEPVKRYRALVSKRFEGGPVVKQLCSEVLPYEPTNYHVEINTLPILVYNVDLNFNEEKLLAIPKPGTIQITNTHAMGKVQFWYQLGDRFVPFLNMEINGKPAEQHADFRPGSYQVRYYKLPVKPYQKAEVVPFSITSDETTKVELQP